MFDCTAVPVLARPVETLFVGALTALLLRGGEEAGVLAGGGAEAVTGPAAKGALEGCGSVVATGGGELVALAGGLARWVESVGVVLRGT